MADGLTVTHTSSVTVDQIDHLGHMNVRYYAINARAATEAVMAGLGHDAVTTPDVFDMYTRHHREQLLGTRLAVRSAILGVDADSIAIYHELVASETGEVAATFVHRVRSGVPTDHVDTIDLPPHGAPRSIDLDAELPQPGIDTLRDLGLALRAARTVDREDTDGGQSVPSHHLPMLLWGGTAPDGTEHELLHAGPGGSTLGFATMETRIGVHRVPSLGTRIQSFTATIAVADKTTQSAMWAYDLDRGDVLVTMQIVNLLFDLDARRAVSIPAAMRAEHEARLHPQLVAT